MKVMWSRWRSHDQVISPSRQTSNNHERNSPHQLPHDWWTRSDRQTHTHTAGISSPLPRFWRSAVKCWSPLHRLSPEQNSALTNHHDRFIDNSSDIQTFPELIVAANALPSFKSAHLLLILQELFRKLFGRQSHFILRTGNRIGASAS